MTKTTAAIVAAAVAFVVVAASLIVLAVWLDAAASAEAASRRTGAQEPSSAAVPDEVAAALRALPGDPGGYVSEATPVTVDWDDAFPHGTVLSPLRDTWSSSEEDTGLVGVTIRRPGESPERYAAMMVREDGRWKVLATVEITTAAAGESEQ